MSLPYEAKQEKPKYRGQGPIRPCTENDYKNHFQTHTSKIHFSQLSVDINTATVKRVSVCPVLYLDG